MKLLHKFKRLKNNTFFASAFSIGSGKLISQFISIITVPLCSRLYSQEAYGEYGLLISTASIISSFVALGLSSAIMAPDDDVESKKVFMTAFWVQNLVETLFIIIVLAIMPVYRLYSVTGSYVLASLLLYFYMLLFNTRQLMSIFVNRRGLNRVLFVNPIIGSLCTLCITLPLGLLQVGYIGFLIAAILGEAIMCAQMIVRANPFLKKYGISDLIYVFKKYKAYTLYQMPANIISGLSVQYPTQFLSRTFGNTQLGSYSMSVQILRYPSQLVATPIGTVYFRTATQYNREGKNLASFTYKLITRIMLIAFIPIISIIVWGPQIFGFVLGSQWTEAGSLSSILILQYVLLFCSQCTSYCRVSLGRQKLNTLYAVVNLVVTIAACAIGYWTTHTLLGTVTVFTIGSCIVYIFDMWLNFRCMRAYAAKYLSFAVIYSLLVLGCWLLVNR